MPAPQKNASGKATTIDASTPALSLSAIAMPSPATPRHVTRSATAFQTIGAIQPGASVAGIAEEERVGDRRLAFGFDLGELHAANDAAQAVGDGIPFERGRANLDRRD